jgi:protein subunit release factor B
MNIVRYFETQERAGIEVGDITRVLDGDLDGFIKAYLMQKASGTLGQPSAADDD